ncbi:Uncharacterized protein HZ326_30481 [Fusarium oxysporum f. sp. albedinis]|nr:Uncharacterized protein HZ326_30481 [Fusarium oxysporum f. sp. albedinis]
MARLKSSSRSRKPGLISRPQQLLSSSSITPNRLARQDASARRTNLSKYLDTKPIKDGPGFGRGPNPSYEQPQFPRPQGRWCGVLRPNQRCL